MADGVDLISSDSIRNMKVADLKRELKARGLSTTGNKNELAERLEAAAGIPKDITDAQLDALDPSLDVNEDEVLSEDSLLLQTEGKANNGDTFPSEEDIISATTTIIKESTPLTLTREGATAKQNEEPVQPASDDPKDKISNKLGLVKVNETPAPGTKCVLATAKASPENLSLEERQALRAKKFNMPLSDGARLKMRMERFGAVGSSEKTTVKTTLGGTPRTGGASIRSSVPPVNLAQLKKRAERFGQSVSTVAKSLEEKERIMKRKERFGAQEVEVSKRAKTLVT
ncbi:SAP domain-containing ribonucleoprotein-like isoform X2 [Ornithodoros turicata]|uniref:SAP domain-containing ribonucleoprotein-like isoform X2 n=1 Tax=Ornithodoros turicata TaxID=34597 RepID=UPI00313A1675